MVVDEVVLVLVAKYDNTYYIITMLNEFAVLDLNDYMSSWSSSSSSMWSCSCSSLKNENTYYIIQ